MRDRIQGHETRHHRKLLLDEIDSSHESRYVQRLSAVLMIISDFDYDQVARLFNKSERTIQIWVCRFYREGMSGLREKERAGRPPTIDPLVLQEIEDALSNPPSEYGYNGKKWIGKFLRHFLITRYQIQLSVRQCQRILKQVRSDSGSP